MHDAQAHLVYEFFRFTMAPGVLGSVAATVVSWLPTALAVLPQIARKSWHFLRVMAQAQSTCHDVSIHALRQVRAAVQEWTFLDTVSRCM